MNTSASGKHISTFLIANNQVMNREVFFVILKRFYFNRIDSRCVSKLTLDSEGNGFHDHHITKNRWQFRFLERPSEKLNT